MNSQLLDKLNKEQKSAVLLIDNPVRIIAGPGSGKTRVLTTKIAYLINFIGIKPYRILALTFTNKAANEMKERLKTMVDEDKANQLHVSTFHSFCYRFLREEIQLLNIFTKEFNILDGVDQDNILKEIYKKFEISKSEISYYFAKSFISFNKNNGINAQELIKNSDKSFDETEKNKIKIYDQYQKMLINSNSLDYDDLLIYTKKIVSEFIEVREKWSKKFDYYLIDEFQDTSKIQYEIINAIALNNNITIVGDPDQTIYSWRGADISFINNFDSLYPNSSTITLIQNYRSTKNILKIANNLIKFNSNRLQKNLVTENDLGNKVEYYKASSTENESKWVYNQILKLKNEKYHLKDMVILYRSNYYSRSIEDLLATRTVPYKIIGGQKFYEREEIKNALAFLRCINHPTDISLKRIINVPSRKLGDETLKKLISFAERKELTLWESWNKYLDFIDISNDKKRSLFNFIQQLLKYQEKIKNNEKIGDTLFSFLEEIGYINMLESSNDNLSISKKENINELISSINKWEEEHPNNNIEDYLNSISLEQIENNDDNLDNLSLMTIHAAKGLEYKIVFVIGMNEGIFPSSKVIKSDDENGESFGMEEERRLAYVAFTRAQDRLFISSYNDPYSEYKNSFSNKPSRFIYEAGLDMNEVSFIEANEKKISLEDNLKLGENEFEIGDYVIHSIFGKGIVLDIKGDSIIIESALISKTIRLPKILRIT